MGLVSGLHPDFPLYCLCHMASSLPASHHLSQLKQEGEFVSSCTSAGALSKWTESRVWNLVSHVLVFSLASLQVHLIPFYSTLTFSKWGVTSSSSGLSSFHLPYFREGVSKLCEDPDSKYCGLCRPLLVSGVSRMVSVTTTQFCDCGVEAATDNTSINE